MGESLEPGVPSPEPAADAPGLVRRRVVVRGRVQGVSFRDTCRGEARTRRVAGWVTNRPDGSVEAVFEGPAELVAQMVAWAGHGPRHARVTEIFVLDVPPVGDDGFRIV